MKKIGSSRPRSVKDAVKAARKPLYHYTNVQDAISILRTKTLWFSEPSALNDPYDCNFNVNHAHLADRCIEAIGEEVLKRLHGRPSSLDGRESFEGVLPYAPFNNAGELQINHQALKRLKRWIATNIAKYDDAVNSILSLIRRDARVTSFCKSGEKLSLWGYYGKSGTGVALIVDFDAKHWANDLLEVEYAHEVPELLTAWNWCEIMFRLKPLQQVLAPERLAQKLLQTKSKDWEHEEEVRFVGFHHCPEIGRDTFSVSQHEIVGVLAGFAVDAVDYSELKKIARKLKVPYGQVKKRDDQFQLYFD